MKLSHIIKTHKSYVSKQVIIMSEYKSQEHHSAENSGVMRCTHASSFPFEEEVPETKNVNRKHKA